MSDSWGLRTRHWLGAALLVALTAQSIPAMSQQALPDIKSLLAALPGSGSETLAGGLSCSTDNSLDLAAGRDGLFFNLSTDLRETFALNSETKSLLKQFADALAERGTTLVAMPIPPRGVVQKNYLNGLDPKQRNFDPSYAADEFALLVQDLRGSGIVTADLLSTIASKNAWSSFYFLRDDRWTTSGAKLAADAVAEALNGVDRYAELPKLKFATTALSSVERKDRMALAIQQLCHRTIPAENDIAFQTVKVADASGPVVASALVGSAFSAPEFNFDGFLEEQTGVEFANYSMNVEDPLGSLASLLSSEAFQKAPPPFLVWEIPPGFNVDLAAFRSFRQIVPAVYGACSGKAVIASSDDVAVSGQTGLIDLTGKSVHGSGYYLRLEASKPGLQGLGLAVTYAGNDADVTVLGSFSGERNGRTFYYQLADEFDGDVAKIILTGETAGATVKLTICEKSPVAVS